MFRVIVYIAIVLVHTILIFPSLVESFCPHSEHGFESPKQISNILHNFIEPKAAPVLVHFLNPFNCDLLLEIPFSTAVITRKKEEYFYREFITKTMLIDEAINPVEAASGWNRVIHLYLMPKRMSVYPKMFEFPMFTGPKHSRYILNKYIQSRHILHATAHSQLPQGVSEGYSRPYDIHIGIILTGESKMTIEHFFETASKFIIIVENENLYNKAYPSKFLILPSGLQNFSVNVYGFCQYCKCPAYRNPPKDLNWIKVSDFDIKQALVHGYLFLTKILNAELVIKLPPFMKIIKVRTNEALDLQLFLAGAPNNVSVLQTSPYGRFPGIDIYCEWFPTLITDTLNVQFLTCDGGYMEKGISFKGFISAFDMPTWFCIATTIFIMGGVYSKSRFNATCNVRNHSKIEKLQIILESLLASIRIFLFQGTEVKVIRFAVPVQIWTCSMFIIGYFYMGDNIGDLTAPKKIIRYKTFEDVLQMNYSFIIVKAPIYNIDPYMDFLNLYAKSPENVRAFLEMSSFGYLLDAKSRSLDDVLNGTKEERLFYQIAIHSEMSDYNDWLSAWTRRPNRCDKVAAVDWSDGLNENEDLFQEEVSRLQEYSNPIISRSVQKLASHYKGWAFSYWGDPWILNRYKSIWSSGIAQFIKGNVSRPTRANLQYKSINKTITFSEKNNDAVEFRVSLKSNTIVIFVAYVVGLLAGCVFVLVEVYTRTNCKTHLKLFFWHWKNKVVVKMHRCIRVTKRPLSKVIRNSEL